MTRPGGVGRYVDTYFFRCQRMKARDHVNIGKSRIFLSDKLSLTAVTKVMLTTAEVTSAFQAILNRLPESEAVIEEHKGFADVTSLCEALVRSVEFRAGLSNRFGLKQTFDISELDAAARAFEANDRGPWQHRSMRLPEWVDLSLDPGSAAFRDQVFRLWAEITGRASYDAVSDEQTDGLEEVDAVRRPAFFASGDSRNAGAHLIAMGHIILRSGISPGDRVIEYGAGFGQTALSLARLGAHVDTVDISPAFCHAVQRNADLFDVDLKPHVGQFGFNPSGENGTYDLVLFYESFHHCADFHALIPRLKQILKPNGRVILAGEPIFDEACQDLPYPWGFRLDWENVAVMRIRGWMELGFQKNYLLNEFRKSGFECTIFTDPNSHWAQVYEFRQVGE